MMQDQKTIIHYLTYYSGLTPDKIALTILGNEDDNVIHLTYHQLDWKVKKLAASLYNMNLGGKSVLLVYQDVADFLVAFLACQYAGIIAVPVPFVNGRKQYARLMYVLRDAQAAAVLCTATSKDILQKELVGVSLNNEVSFIGTDDMILQSAHIADIAPQFQEVSFIQYTSGSTGHPKGVVITASNLLHNQQSIQGAFGVNTTSVIFSWLPFYHDMGLIGNLLHTIYTGCKAVLMSPSVFVQSPRKWLEAITRYKVTHSGAPNFAFDLCVSKVPKEETSQFNLSSWIVAFNGSEPVRADTIARFSDHFKSGGFDAEAWHPCYGLAEATLMVSGSKPSKSHCRTLYVNRDALLAHRIVLEKESAPGSLTLVSSGRIVQGIDVCIMTPDGDICENDEAGEICIAGGSVSRGYWNKDMPALFHETGMRKWLRTGDLGFLYENELYVCGRLKEMLIVRGKNIYPYDLEQQLAADYRIIENNGVAIFSRGNSDDQVVIVAEIKRSELRKLDHNALISAIDKYISGTAGISPFDIVLTTPLGIPRTTSGKLQRVKCRDHYEQLQFNVLASKRSSAMSVDHLQQNMTLIQDVLQQPETENIRLYILDLISFKTGQSLSKDITDPTELTELGVDSLRATEILHTIHKDLGIHIDVSRIYQYNTLFDLISTIENMLWLRTAQNSGKEISI